MENENVVKAKLNAKERAIMFFITIGVGVFCFCTIDPFSALVIVLITILFYPAWMKSRPYRCVKCQSRRIRYVQMWDRNKCDRCASRKRRLLMLRLDREMERRFIKLRLDREKGR